MRRLRERHLRGEQRAQRRPRGRGCVISTRSPRLDELRAAGRGRPAGKSWRGSSSMTSAKCSCSSRRGGALRDDAAAVHDGDLIAQQLGLLHVVRGEDDGLAARLDRLHQLPEVAPRLRIEPGGRLVEEQHRRVVDQRDGQQQPLLLAAGELAAVAVGQLLQRAQADDFLDLEPARRTARGTARCSGAR